MNCKHKQMVEAQGVGGGHIFKYCNECGMTEYGIKKINVLREALLNVEEYLIGVDDDKIAKDIFKLTKVKEV